MTPILLLFAISAARAHGTQLPFARSGASAVFHKFVVCLGAAYVFPEKAVALEEYLRQEVSADEAIGNTRDLTERISAVMRVQQEPSVPLPDTKPLPPIAQLLEDVEKHEDRDADLLQQYTYHRRVVQEEYAGKQKTTAFDYESIPIAGVRVNKLVARDGKPLSAEEVKKVDGDFDKAVEKAKKNKAKFDYKRAQAEREGKSNDEFLHGSRILQLGTFSNERRILLNGRSTIVLDYTGNKDVKSKGELERAVQDLVGTAWIDEEDKVLARAEGRFLADFKIAFGLVADIHKDFRFSMEQRKINGEVWLPKEIDSYGQASVGVFVARVNGHTQVESSDYRKFRTTSTIIGTSGAIDANGNPIPDPAAKPEQDTPKR